MLLGSERATLEIIERHALRYDRLVERLDDLRVRCQVRVALRFEERKSLRLRRAQLFGRLKKKREISD